MCIHWKQFYNYFLFITVGTCLFDKNVFTLSLKLTHIAKDLKKTSFISILLCHTSLFYYRSLATCTIVEIIIKLNYNTLKY